MDISLLIQNLSKRFGAIEAAKGVTLEVGTGQIHALIGPNGAGKTTVFNCVTGFLRPDSGKVLLNRKEVTSWPPHKLVKAGIVRTFQITNIFSEQSVLENVQLAVRSKLGKNLDMFGNADKMSQVQREAEEILQIVDLLDRAHVLGEELGHGDRRVLEVAIGLALNPKILLLDEPTAGMSRSETERIAELVQRITDRTSILLVEHDMEMVLSISHRITVMTQGKVIAQGTPEQVSKNSRVQDAYLGEVELGT